MKLRTIAGILLGSLLAVIVYMPEIRGQQLITPKLILEPDHYSFALSGLIGLNLKQQQNESGSPALNTSGKLTLDAWIFKQVIGSIRLYPGRKELLYKAKLADIQDLAFSQHHSFFNSSVSFHHPIDEELYLQYFLDFHISEFPMYYATDAKADSLNFGVNKTQIGAHVFWNANWEQDLILGFAMKMNYQRFHFHDPVRNPFYQSYHPNADSKTPLLIAYWGAGIKSSIQINSLSVYFETQYFFKGDDRHDNKAKTLFSGQNFYTIGLESNQAVILGKRKKSRTKKTGP